ncbi:uncharacterized protein LOC124283259 [Haliotis rubra]|uniref:uncharacterized protein LOC124283259 n=1 Tax=Haliotis rubra TaxID=36100 RepID=UPI001EE5B23E|nr:uncharacterized protein LOC124283259 [Haliotis rubra]
MCHDLFLELVKEFFEQDSDRKAEIQQNLKEKTETRIVGNLEKVLSAKGNGYCIGETLSLGDLVIYDTLDGRVEDDIIDKNPNVKAVAEQRQIQRQNRGLSGSKGPYGRSGVLQWNTTLVSTVITGYLTEMTKGYRTLAAPSGSAYGWKER